MKPANMWLACACLASVSYGVYAWWRDRPTEEEQQETRVVHVESPPYRLVEIVEMQWKKGGLGSVMLVDLTIANYNAYPVSDLKIACDVKGNSGTIISTPHRVLYETLGPSEKKRLREVNMGFIDSQASRAECSVIDARR